MELAIGEGRESGQKVLVVLVAESEAGGADPVLLQAGGDDVLDGAGINDAGVELAIGQEQQSAGGLSQGVAVGIPAKHPAAREVGGAAGFDLGDGL